MIFKILPFIALLGIGIRFWAKIAAVNAYRKRLQAEQDGRTAEPHAEKETFWRRVDRICIVLVALAAVWYAFGVFLWLFGG